MNVHHHPGRVLCRIGLGVTWPEWRFNPMFAAVQLVRLKVRLANGLWPILKNVLQVQGSVATNDNLMKLGPQGH